MSSNENTFSVLWIDIEVKIQQIKSQSTFSESNWTVAACSTASRIKNTL